MRSRPVRIRRVSIALLPAALCGSLLLLAGPALARSNERDSVRTAVEELSAPELTEEQRERLIADLLQRAGEDRSKLRKATLREFESLRKSYAREFERTAAALLSEKSRSAPAEEVALIRADALRVGAAKGATEEEIRAVCDPAVERLVEWLTISPQAVLESSEQLASTRAQLMLLATIWWRAGDPDDGGEMNVSAVDSLLVADEAFATVLGWDLDPGDQRILVGNRKIGAKIDPREEQTILLLNLRRLLFGLDALAIDTRLVYAGRDHSRDMAKLGFRGHDSPVAARSDATERAERYGTRPSGENVAFGPWRAEKVIDMWWHSPSHHRVMMGAHTRAGVGRYDRYWTMVLGSSDQVPSFAGTGAMRVDDPPPPPPRTPPAPPTPPPTSNQP